MPERLYPKKKFWNEYRSYRKGGMSVVKAAVHAAEGWYYTRI